MLHPYQKQGSAPQQSQEDSAGRPLHVPKLLRSSTSLSGHSLRDELWSSLFSNRKDLQGLPVSRKTGELQLHPVLIQLNLVPTLINCTIHGRKPSETIPEPILITSSNIIISGVREWHAAVSEGRPVLACTEYRLTDDEALQLILILQQSRSTWNDFTRIRLALEQEPYLQLKAHANKVAGGKDKGLANLPEAKRIDVREEIAYLAGACPRNVSKVRTIVLKGHPRLVDACQTGILTIHRASKLCRVPGDKQVEEFSRYLMNAQEVRPCVNLLTGCE
jgi:hypothetical protein